MSLFYTAMPKRKALRARKSHRYEALGALALSDGEISAAHILLDFLKTPVLQSAQGVFSYRRIIHVCEDSHATSSVSFSVSASLEASKAVTMVRPLGVSWIR